MKINDTPRLRITLILSAVLLFFLFVFAQRIKTKELFASKWNAPTESNKEPLHNPFATEPKQKGAHVFGYLDSTDFQTLRQNNLEWITLVAWGFQKDFDSPIVTHHDGDSLHIQQHDSSWVRQIGLVRAAGFKVFFKPHLWIDSPTDGKWRADIVQASPENWELWASSYRNFIIRYAKVAEQAHAEMYCIGAEFSRLSSEKPEYWKTLIHDIRQIYSGKLTYAANWYDEYEKITFWSDLDYIGVQAYFPLAKNRNPSVEQIAAGWNNYLPALESISKKYNRQILFTEMGYKSTSESAIEPWHWIEKNTPSDSLLSLETQANCYQAFFNTVWQQEWFAGVHIWQLRTKLKRKHRENNMDFTPQGKPAELVIAKGFE